MDELSLPSTVQKTIALIEAISISVDKIKDPEKSKSIKKNDYTIISLGLELELCQEKLESWVEYWEIGSNEPEEDTWQYLWGFEGYEWILALSKEIFNRAKELQQLVGSRNGSEAETGKKLKNRLSLRRKKAPSADQFQHVRINSLAPQVESLRRKIDELRLFSESSFEVNDPEGNTDVSTLASDPVVALALETKGPSIALASICSAPSRCFGLSLQFSSSTKDSNTYSGKYAWQTHSLTYGIHLVPQIHNTQNHTRLSIGSQARVTSSFLTPQARSTTSDILDDAGDIAGLGKGLPFQIKSPNGLPNPTWNDQRRISETLESLSLSVSRESVSVIGDPTPRRGSRPQPIRSRTIDSSIRSSSPERMDEGTDEFTSRVGSTDDSKLPLETFHIESPADPKAKGTEVECLHYLLQKLENSADEHSPIERFSLANKIEIAHVIVYAGLLLLGTPWLSYLRSGNIFRGPDGYILSTPTSNFTGHPYKRASDISETSHIYHIGILLMEIALGKPAESLDLQDNLPYGIPSRHLPEIERAMGVQYRKAVAFCMQPRCAPAISQSLSKYSVEDWPEWKIYLEKITLEFRSNVYQNIDELYKSM